MIRDKLPHLWPGDAALALLAVLPLLAALPATVAMAPDSVEAGLRAAGKLSGVIGLGWLLLAALLAVRIPRLDYPFGGLVRVWRVHHLIGTGAFLLLLAHPLLLAMAASAEGAAAGRLVLFPPLARWEIWAGWVALIALMVVLAPTYGFFGQPRYQRWKLLHALSGIALLLAVVHALPLATAPGGGAAWALWGGLGGAALAAYSWRTVLSRLARHPYRITAVKPLAPRVVELSLEPESGERLRYSPGQFVYLSPEDPALAAGYKEEHPYTLSSAPQEGELRIAIKDLGDASHALQTVATGSRARIEGPYGRFFPDSHQTAELWIGGGIGVTPFVSRLRALQGTRDLLDIHFVYCAHDPGRSYFLEELESIASRLSGLRITAHYFAEQGPLSRAFLDRHAEDFLRRTAYICGPMPLMELATGILRAAGVPRARIHSEEFDLL